MGLRQGRVIQGVEAELPLQLGSQKQSLQALGSFWCLKAGVI